MSTIEDVKTRLDIVETVGSYVPNLKRSGRTWKANCPFHNERTPSFIVDPSRGSWHCFGACSTGGDVIEFVRRIEGLDFREALGRCAERAGVELRPPTRREVERREEHERLLAANDAATLFYQAQLAGPRGAEARDYAERRGLDAATQREWQLGYAPDEWSALTDHLTARGFRDRSSSRRASRSRASVASTTASAGGSSSRPATCAGAWWASVAARSAPTRSRST